MTEEQRMEEGRRMFQIFAARMFEQRVLTAYREKVARERQEKLLEELADESRLDAEREAKKAKEAQKKKDKKKQQKAAREEERQKKEAEKAAEEAAAKAAEEQRLEAQRQKKDEQRKKREAERKAQEEEKQRKEAEKQRRVQEAREQQAENERKQRELKEKEKRRKEEARKKEREDREAKEREKRERELAEKREKESKAKAEKDAKDRAKKDEQARKEESVKQAAHEAPVLQAPPLRKGTSPAVPAPPGLGGPSTNHISPHPQIATPIVPKAPTPMRARQTSNQGSHQSSPKSAHLTTASAAGSPSRPIPTQVAAVPGPPKGLQPLSLGHTHQPAVMSPTAPPPGIFSDASMGIASPHDTGLSGFPTPHGAMMPGAMPRGPNIHDMNAMAYSQQPYSAPPHRVFHSPNPMAFPPGIHGMRPMHHGNASPINGPIAQPPIGSGVTSSTQTQPSSHSRQASMESAAQSIARPNPIQRPSSTPQNDRKGYSDYLN